jgi:hypothetical protein
MEDSYEETGLAGADYVAIRDDRNRGDMRLLDACPCAEKQ